MASVSALSGRKARSDTRGRILNAARDAFIAGGGEIEMGEVARRAGVSNGLAYHYFGSKAGLLAALVDDFYTRYDAAAMAAVPATGNWGERMRHHIRAGIEYMYQDPLGAALLGRLGASAEVSAAEARRQMASTERAVGNLRRAQQRGDIAPVIDVEIAGAVIIGAVRQVLLRVFQMPERPSADTVATELWATIATVLGIPPAPTV